MTEQIKKGINSKELMEISDHGRLIANPVVSVLMLAYNHGPYLAESIEGVLMQKTDVPIELLIGEDCSTDNTRDIALHFQVMHPNIVRVITTQHNVGMQENFRRLFDASRGKYIAICEGDDYWIASDKISRQVAIFEERSEITAVFTDFVCADFISGHWKIAQHENAFRWLNKNDLRGDLTDKPLDGRLRTLTSMYRRSVIKNLFKKKIDLAKFKFADNFLMAQAIENGLIERIDCVTAVYRRSTGSATRSNAVSNMKFLESVRYFYENINSYFPASRHVDKELMREINQSIWKAAYIAGDISSSRVAEEKIKELGFILPIHLRLLGCIGRIDGLRLISIRIRKKFKK